MFVKWWGMCVNDYTAQQQQQTNNNIKQHNNNNTTTNFNLIERMSRAESDFVMLSKGPEPVRIYKG